MTDFEGDSPKRKVPRRSGSSDGDDDSMAANPTDSPRAAPIADPIVDGYTRLLGIGWTSATANSDVAAMARGYTRYIVNHYPLTNVEILAMNKGSGIYLVESSQGYFVFNEELNSGRLVARTKMETIANLLDSPVRYSSATPLFAARTPEKTNNNTGFSGMMEEGDMELD